MKNEIAFDTLIYLKSSKYDFADISVWKT